MKARLYWNIVILASILILLLGMPFYLGRAAPLAQEETDVSSGSFIHLQFATFDPTQTLPLIPQPLSRESYSGRLGPYIVQFQGPVKPEWKEAVTAVGGQIDSYLPDYAFIVRMDDSTRARVESFSFVRWVGIYQPAYKMSPQLTASPINLYRVHLAKWADVDQVRNNLASLSGGVRGDGISLVVNAQFDQLTQIAQIPDVLWIEEFYFFEKHNNVATGIMNATTSWGQGYTGSGQTVTIADTGLDTGVDNPLVSDDIHRDFDNRVAQISSWPLPNDPICLDNPSGDDGASDVDSGHGTHVAGSVGGNGARSSGQYRGTAFGATLTFQAVEQFADFSSFCESFGLSDGYGLYGIPTDLNDLFQESYNWGARIHTNSWGTDVDGEYTESSQQADEFAWNNKNFTILFSAGNAGVDADSNGYVDEDSMGSPGTAKNVITIGASENNRGSGGYNPGGPCWTYGNCWPSDFPANPTNSDGLSDDPDEMAAFSSRGPTDDGRIKPDLVAPGTNILSTRSGLISGNGWGAGPSSYYMYMGGTSMATPLSAGAATVVRDYLVDGEGHSNPSSALIKALLINSAVNINGYGNSSQEAGQPIPNNHEGWGRIDLAAATNNTNRTFVDDQSLTTAATHVYSFTNMSAAIPFKTSLVWTDYPGNPAAGTQLVNNLNLKVTAPNGTTIYRGNNFSNGWSTTGGSADAVNNVENVYIQSPATGVWTIELSGANVPQGPQPYALVVSGQGTLNGPNTGPSANQNIYLPIIMKNSSGGSSGGGGGGGGGSSITNGDFESGSTGWVEYSTHGWNLITTSFPGTITPHSGSWAVWLGGDYDDISYIQQQVTVPSGSPYLAYWHWIASEDVCGYDFGGVIINGSTVVDVYDLCTSMDTGGWVKHIVNLSAYAGQSVSLQLRAETDSLLNSNLFIDDVSFQISSTSVDTFKPDRVPALDLRDASPKEQSQTPDVGVPNNENQDFLLRLAK